MLRLMQRLVNRRDNEKGASAVEYGLLVAAIAAIIVLIVFAIGKFVKAGFKTTCEGLAGGTYASGVGAPASCPNKKSPDHSGVEPVGSNPSILSM